MIVNDIIEAARRKLGDVRKERWSDEQLILEVALCQNDICSITGFYRKDALIPLLKGQTIYDLPTDCLTLTRAEYQEKLIPIQTRNDIDSGKAIFPCILKDNLQHNKLEIVIDGYDIASYAVSGMYGLVAQVAGADCDLSLQDEYGVVADVSETSVVEEAIHIYYRAVPKMVTSLTDVLVLPDYYFSAFLHYVVGSALQYDNDANNINRGELELQKYNRVLTQIYKSVSKDFTSNMKGKLDTDYRRVI